MEAVGLALDKKFVNYLFRRSSFYLCNPVWRDHENGENFCLLDAITLK